MCAPVWGLCFNVFVFQLCVNACVLICQCTNVCMCVCINVFVY